MAQFDPSKPIDDPVVWFPKGMFIVNKAQKLTIVAYAVDTADEEEKTFILNRDKMVALSRFLWTGKLLPTNRDSYIKTLGLTTTSAMSTKVWAEVDSLIKTYTEVNNPPFPEQEKLANKTALSPQISKDCSQFKDVTWDKLVKLSGQIKTYATLAGGSSTSSYYQAILEWVGEYNDEKGKTSPDQKVLDELASGIKGAIEAQQKIIQGIQAHVAEALTALATFHDNCKRYQSTLQGDGETLKSLLEEEGNDIEHLKREIEEQLKDIEDLQVQIDADHQKIKETAYYVWIPFAGTVAAVTVTVMANEDIKRLKKAMEKIEAVLDVNQIKLETAYRLQGDISSMGAQVTNLLNVIAPAIETLEALQGAWSHMNADLQTLYDLIDAGGQSIPPMLLAKKQLQNIVDSWNELKVYAENYIENAFMSTDPEKLTMKSYIKQLESHLK
ncbi:hypothetical protein PT974_04816 [Cladobotryum mycophilum]|uniref:Uncharacterized protein n=1 Tax=Cladobotryum mycophilum TaxID=491253 RepID=A0ABR0SQ95_9HYPO